MALGWSRSAVLGLIVCGASCSGQRSVLEDRGPLLAGDAAVSGGATFAWLPAGEEIAYLSDASQIVAVRIADGARRQLDPGRPYFVTDVVRSRDGSALYFIAQDLSNGVARYTLREALAHQELPLGEILPGNPAVSPDGRRVLYWTAAGASVRDASGAIFAASPCSASPVLPLFSPAGDQLLCGHDAPFLVNLPDGSTQTLPQSHPISWRAVLWDDAGPRAVALTPEVGRERVDLVDVAGGEVHSLYETDGLLDLANAAISQDGHHVAFWETECLRADSILSCQAGQTEARLKVVDVSSRRAATIASGAAWPGPIAFSDDGTRVAYLFQAGTGKLHVRPLP